MKRLRLRPEEPVIEPEPADWHVKSIGRLVKICNARGYEVSFADARAAWERYSESYCAGWLSLDGNDDETFRRLMDHLVCDEEGEVAG